MLSNYWDHFDNNNRLCFGMPGQKNLSLPYLLYLCVTELWAQMNVVSTFLPLAKTPRLSLCTPAVCCWWRWLGSSNNNPVASQSGNSGATSLNAGGKKAEICQKNWLCKKCESPSRMPVWMQPDVNIVHGCIHWFGRSLNPSPIRGSVSVQADIVLFCGPGRENKCSRSWTNTGHEISTFYMVVAYTSNMFSFK